MTHHPLVAEHTRMATTRQNVTNILAWLRWQLAPAKSVPGASPARITVYTTRSD
jgi:hypothetical protein